MITASLKKSKSFHLKICLRVASFLNFIATGTFEINKHILSEKIN